MFVLYKHVSFLSSLCVCRKLSHPYFLADGRVHVPKYTLLDLGLIGQSMATMMNQEATVLSTGSILFPGVDCVPMKRASWHVACVLVWCCAPNQKALAGKSKINAQAPEIVRHIKRDLKHAVGGHSGEANVSRCDCLPCQRRDNKGDER